MIFFFKLEKKKKVQKKQIHPKKILKKKTWDEFCKLEKF